jgi:elongation factor G
MASFTLGLIAHVGAGKTSLAEAMLARSGAVARKPAAGASLAAAAAEAASLLDFLPEEREHRSSLKCALAHLSYGGHALDLLDTPGSLDFIGDTTAALRVIDGALLLSSAEPGLQGQTEYLWERLEQRSLPRLLVITKLDREQADFPGRLEQLRQSFGNRIVAVQLPWGKAEGLRGIVDVLESCAYDYADPAKPKRVAIPAELAAAAAEHRHRLIEMVAESDDALLEKYLDTEELTPAELRAGLIQGTKACKLVPVLCAVPTRQIGIDTVLEAAVTWLPDVAERKAQRQAAEQTVDGYARDCMDNPHCAALVFKTQLDHYAGRLSLVRVMSGELRAGEELLNPATGATERPAHLYKLTGREQTEVKTLKAGELGVLPKLAHTHTGHSLCSPKRKVEFAPIDFPLPVLTYALQLPVKGEEEKVSTALHRMSESDPTLGFRHNAETGDFLVSGMGKAHLDLALERLQRDHRIAARFTAPHVPYRETIRAPAKAQGKYKKQTGGHGQYGDCWLELRPRDQTEPLAFHSAIVGGAIPRNFIPAVEKGVTEAMHKGVLAGFPVIGIDATVYDGSYHDVDSSEMAFKIAGSMAFKKAMESARPVLLEPILELEIVVPGENMGDVLGDINARRGRVLGMDNRGPKQVVRAEVPMAESLSYAIDLRALTSGQGYFTQKVSRYEEVPDHLADRIVKERQTAPRE